MVNPTITLVMRGNKGGEIVNYGYVNHAGVEMRIKNGQQLTTTMQDYTFRMLESEFPRSAWVTYTNAGTNPATIGVVFMGGLKYNNIDMLDPATTYPPSDIWRSAGWGEKDVQEAIGMAKGGYFGWGGTYRMGFDSAKLPGPPPPPPPPPVTPPNPPPPGTPPGSPPGTPPGSPPGTPPGSPPGTPPGSPIWNPGSPGFFSASNIGMWTYIMALIGILAIIFFVM